MEFRNCAVQQAGGASDIAGQDPGAAVDLGNGRVHARLDAAAAEQVLLDLKADCQPGVLGTVVTDVTAQSLVPQLQSMLR